MLECVKVFVLLCVLSGLLGCAQKSTSSIEPKPKTQAAETSVFISSDIYDKVDFVDHSQSPLPYLAMNVFFEPMAEIRKYIESLEKVKLQHRGEAHITVITPMESEKLKPFLSAKLVNEVALLNRIQESPFEIICLAKASKKEDNKILTTYYIVVEAPELLALRQTLATLLKNKGGRVTDFNADEFYPHITVGFTERDLHLQDGVVKNKATCFIEMQIKAQ